MKWLKVNWMYERKRGQCLSRFYFSWYQIGGIFSDINWVSSNSVQFWQTICSYCRSHGLKVQSHRASNAGCKYQYFWSTSYMFTGSYKLLLGFNNLLERLTELRKTLDLLLPVYYKGYNLGTARWKRCIGKEYRKGSFYTGSFYVLLTLTDVPWEAQSLALRTTAQEN